MEMLFAKSEDTVTPNKDISELMAEASISIINRNRETASVRIIATIWLSVRLEIKIPIAIMAAPMRSNPRMFPITTIQSTELNAARIRENTRVIPTPMP